MKKMKTFLSVLATVCTITMGCNNKKPSPAKTCLPPFIHSSYSDSLAAINHNISLQDAKALIKRYKDYKKAILKGQIQDSLCRKTVKSETFNRAAFYDLINKDSIVGVRILFGINTNNQLVEILCAVKSNGKIDTSLLREMGQTEPDNDGIVNIDANNSLEPEAP